MNQPGWLDVSIIADRIINIIQDDLVRKYCKNGEICTEKQPKIIKKFFRDAWCAFDPQTLYHELRNDAVIDRSDAAHDEAEQQHAYAQNALKEIKNYNREIQSQVLDMLLYPDKYRKKASSIQLCPGHKTNQTFEPNAGRWRFSNYEADENRREFAKTYGRRQRRNQK